MVHRHKPVLFFAPLVHGEVGDPQEVKGAGLDEVQLAGQMAAQGAQAVENHLVFAVGHQEEDIAGLCAQGGADGGFLLLGEEFLIGGGLGLSGQAGKGQALSPVGFDKVGQLVDLFAGEGSRRTFHIDAPGRFRPPPEHRRTP